VGHTTSTATPRLHRQDAGTLRTESISRLTATTLGRCAVAPLRRDTGIQCHSSFNSKTGLTRVALLAGRHDAAMVVTVITPSTTSHVLGSLMDTPYWNAAIARASDQAATSGSTGSANKGSSARQNVSPTSVAHCHDARTRLGPRGGGRLRVLSPAAVAPPSLFAAPVLPADAAPSAHVARHDRTREPAKQACCSEPSRATRIMAQQGNASGGVGSAWPLRSSNSSTVGDMSPGDAFPASSSLVRGRKCVSLARSASRATKPDSPFRAATLRRSRSRENQKAAPKRLCDES